jgi:hypothetical protein
MAEDLDQDPGNSLLLRLALLRRLSRSFLSTRVESGQRDHRERRPGEEKKQTQTKVYRRIETYSSLITGRSIWNLSQMS